MRPGRFHPGNLRAAEHTLQALIDRFNEAGAFPPRKSTRTGSSIARCDCFNEAGAFPPRKSPSRLA